MAKNRTIPSALFMLVIAITCIGAPYYNYLTTLKQPSGKKIKVKVWGDEFYTHIESLDGYTLIRDVKNTNAIYYATLSSDSSCLISTGILYSQPTLPQNKPLIYQKKPLEKHLTPLHSFLTEEIKFKHQTFSSSIMKTSDSSSRTAYPLQGTVRVITIPVEFSDEKTTVSQQSIYDFLNKKGSTQWGNNGSIHDYFAEVSNGKIDYQSLLIDTYTALYPKTHYSDPTCPWPQRSQELVKEAIRWLEQKKNFDFSLLSTDATKQVYAVNVLYAGDPDMGWSLGLWPHSGSLPTTQTINGTNIGRYLLAPLGDSLSLQAFCHETGHLIFGWPDLYDPLFSHAGIGNYCIMSYGAHPKNPIPPCAYLRMLSGWENTKLVTRESLDKIYDLETNTNTSIKYAYSGHTNEFFLFEARQKTGRNQFLPDQGLIIWHIDEFGGVQNTLIPLTKQNRISLEQADGKFDLEQFQNLGDQSDLYESYSTDSASTLFKPAATWNNKISTGLSISKIIMVNNRITFTLDIKNQVSIVAKCIGKPIKGCQISSWRADQAYKAESVVSFRGHTWTSRWWTKAEEPGNSEVWRDEGECPDFFQYHGMITPNGIVTVPYGAGQTFFFFPDPGYIIKSARIDGTPTTIVNNQYSFESVETDHCLEVEFDKE